MPLAETMAMRTASAFLLVLALASMPVLADTPMDFSGEWTGSDNAADADHAAASDAASANSHGSGRHGGHGGMGGMHGGRHGQGASNATGDSSHEKTTPANPRLHAHTLVIRQSEVVFDVAADGQRTPYRFDNRNNYGAAYGGTVTLTWSAPEMVIETHPDSGGTIVEHFTLSADGKQLTLRTSTQRPGDAEHEVTRAFTRSDAASSAPLP